MSRISRDRILYEDEYLLAVNKLAGELVVKGRGAVQKLPLLDFLAHDYPGLRALHRLDFETSGVVLFGKRRDVLREVLSSKFAGWKKTYITLVAGRIPRQSGVIEKKLPSRTKEMIPAVTHYRVLERFANSTYVEARIETGRHHQIRRHFAGIGHPLVLDDLDGDVKFNRVFVREFRYRRFFLHAARLELPHPVTGKHIVIAASLPKAFLDVLTALHAL